MNRNDGKIGRAEVMSSNISMLKLQQIRNRISSWKIKTANVYPINKQSPEALEEPKMEFDADFSLLFSNLVDENNNFFAGKAVDIVPPVDIVSTAGFGGHAKFSGKEIVRNIN